MYAQKHISVMFSLILTMSITLLGHKAALSALDQVYFMTYFRGNDLSQEKLFYAYSFDALSWTVINRGRYVFDANSYSVALRDPYLRRITQNGVTKYHMVHTDGWTSKYIFHWESTDLINWTGGRVPVMVGTSAPNSWAPEFTYVEEENIFYVYWSSREVFGSAREKIIYTTTTDWNTIAEPAVYFDPGFAVIDMTVTEHNGIYYGIYKTEIGSHSQRHLLLATSTSMNPAASQFEGTTDILTSVRGVEGPATIKLIGENKWYLYYDFFTDASKTWGASESFDLTNWTELAMNKVKFPPNSRHGSVEIITWDELVSLLNHYNDPIPEPPTIIREHEQHQKPTGFLLEQNHPNPFNPETQISYQLAKTGQVRLEIFNLLGQKVKTLVNSYKPTGIYSVRWNRLDEAGKSVLSGVYFYQIGFETPSQTYTKSKKMLLFKCQDHER